MVPEARVFVGVAVMSGVRVFLKMMPIISDKTSIFRKQETAFQRYIRVCSCCKKVCNCQVQCPFFFLHYIDILEEGEQINYGQECSRHWIVGLYIMPYPCSTLDNFPQEGKCFSSVICVRSFAFSLNLPHNLPLVQSLAHFWGTITVGFEKLFENKTCTSAFFF